VIAANSWHRKMREVVGHFILILEALPRKTAAVPSMSEFYLCRFANSTSGLSCEVKCLWAMSLCPTDPPLSS